MLRAVLVIIVFAAVVYALVWVIQNRGSGGSRPAPRRPVAPDDDPEFLRHLDRKRRRDPRNQHPGKPQSGGPAPDPPTG
jgi:hypothetical protein